MTKDLIKATKLVNVYNSINNSLTEINIPKEISNRKELVSYLDKYNIDHDNTTMMIAETDLVLALESSIIPDDDFTLVLTSKKVKSGLDFTNASYKEMKEFIKKETQKDKDKVRQYFGNYTQLSTNKMRQLLSSYPSSNINTNNISIVDGFKLLLNEFIKNIDNLIEKTIIETKVGNEEDKKNSLEKTKLEALKNKYGDKILDI